MRCFIIPCLFLSSSSSISASRKVTGIHGLSSMMDLEWGFLLFLFWYGQFLSLCSSCYSIASAFVLFFFGLKICGILAPRLEIQLTLPALKGKLLTTRPPGKSWGFLVCLLLGPFQNVLFYCEGCDNFNFKGVVPFWLRSLRHIAKFVKKWGEASV